MVEGCRSPGARVERDITCQNGTFERRCTATASHERGHRARHEWNGRSGATIDAPGIGGPLHLSSTGNGGGQLYPCKHSPWWQCQRDGALDSTKGTRQHSMAGSNSTGNTDSVVLPAHGMCSRLWSLIVCAAQTEPDLILRVGVTDVAAYPASCASRYLYRESRC